MDPQPRVKPYTFPPATTLIPDDQYVDAHVVDISAFPFTESGDIIGDMTPVQRSAHDDIVRQAFNALKHTGLLVVKGHGLSSQAFQRQFDLGQLFLNEVPDDDKQRLHAKIWEGDWSGYKTRSYHKRPDGSMDSHEHCDFYPSTIVEDRVPDPVKPFIQEIRNFAHFNHYHLLRRVLAIISIGLGLRPQALWKLHNHEADQEQDKLLTSSLKEVNWRHSKDHLRYALYHPPSAEDAKKKKHLWLPAHTDLGSCSFLYSQPIAGLQILTRNGEWRYVRYYPEHIIVNLGDSLEFLTGGILKSVPHRVHEPPEDQKHLSRLGIFYFVPFLGDVPLRPLDDFVAAKDPFEEYRALGGKQLTSDEWYTYRSKLVGTKRRSRGTRTAEDALEDIHFRYNPS